MRHSDALHVAVVVRDTRRRGSRQGTESRPRRTPMRGEHNNPKDSSRAPLGVKVAAGGSEDVLACVRVCVCVRACVCVCEGQVSGLGWKRTSLLPECFSMAVCAVSVHSASISSLRSVFCGGGRGSVGVLGLGGRVCEEREEERGRRPKDGGEGEDGKSDRMLQERVKTTMHTRRRWSAQAHVCVCVCLNVCVCVFECVCVCVC